MVSHCPFGNKLLSRSQIVPLQVSCLRPFAPQVSWHPYLFLSPTVRYWMMTLLIIFDICSPHSGLLETRHPITFSLVSRYTGHSGGYLRCGNPSFIWDSFECINHVWRRLVRRYTPTTVDSGDVISELAGGIPLKRYTYFSNGGYAFTIRGNETSQDEIDQIFAMSNMLEEAGWLDASTRAVFVEFFVYSVFRNRLSHVLLAAQFTPSMQVCTCVCIRAGS